jgi:cobalt-zinc-cadmium efflux system membrane fusion protein
MNRILLLLAACLASAAACGRSQQADDGHPDRHDREELIAPGAAARSGDDVLRVVPEMMRDLRVTTAPVEERGAVEGAAVLGELGPNEDAYAIVASPISARIRRMIARPAERVDVGQPLAELESVKLGRGRAELLASRARLDLARQTLTRTRGLTVERIAPRRELEEAEARAATARADVTAAEAALGALGVREEAPDSRPSESGRFVLRSPIAGTVIERTGAQGEAAEPGHALFRVGDLSRLWLTVHAFERDAVALRTGQAAEVFFAALPGRAYTGPITNIGGQVDARSRTVPIRIAIDNTDDILRPGMSATAVLPAGDQQERILAVPTAALQRLANGWYVFVPRGDAVFEMRQVGRGRDLTGEVEILSGLRAGEQVVVEGSFLLKAEAEQARGEGGHHEH